MFQTETPANTEQCGVNCLGLEGGQSLDCSPGSKGHKVRFCPGWAVARVAMALFGRWQDLGNCSQHWRSEDALWSHRCPVGRLHGRSGKLQWWLKDPGGVPEVWTYWRHFSGLLPWWKHFESRPSHSASQEGQSHFSQDFWRQSSKT